MSAQPIDAALRDLEALVRTARQCWQRREVDYLPVISRQVCDDGPGGYDGGDGHA